MSSPKRRRNYLAALAELAERSGTSFLIVIRGPPGAGKTSLALHTLRDVYGSWPAAIQYLFFEPDDFFSSALLSGAEHRMMLAAAFDDAGLWLQRSMWYVKSIAAFSNLMSVARSLVRLAMFTVISADLPSALMRKVTHTLVAQYPCALVDAGALALAGQAAPGGLSCGKLMRRFEGSRRVRGESTLVWSRWYPDDVYAVYEVLRKYKVMKYEALAALMSGLSGRAEEIVSQMKLSINGDLEEGRRALARLGASAEQLADFEEKLRRSLDVRLLARHFEL